MDLYEALIESKEDRVTAFVGGGGKTSLMFGLARELAARGERVLATTTTNIIAPSEKQAQSLLLSEDLNAIVEELDVRFQHQRLVAVGTRVVTADRKMKGIPPDWVDVLVELPYIDRVIVEADGSAGRPFKAPADHEPVIPSATNIVVPVVGIDILGQPLGSEHVHRPEIVAGIGGIAIGQTITPEVVARVIADPRGGSKGAPNGARVVAAINKVDDDTLREKARKLGHLMLESETIRRVVIARARHEPPVWEVLRRR